MTVSREVSSEAVQTGPVDNNAPSIINNAPITSETGNEVNSGIAVLMDSNRRHMGFQKLFPNDQVRVYPCGTVSYAFQKISNITQPRLVIIHLGTNDLESCSPQEVHQNILRLKDTIESKFHCRTLVSSLLPRNDSLDQSVRVCNSLLHSSIPEVLIEHKNIRQEHLHDKKHLSFNPISYGSPSGCQLLAQNLFAAVHGSPPPSEFLQVPRKVLKKRGQRRDKDHFTSFPNSSNHQSANVVPTSTTSHGSSLRSNILRDANQPQSAVSSSSIITQTSPAIPQFSNIPRSTFIPPPQFQTFSPYFQFQTRPLVDHSMQQFWR